MVEADGFTLRSSFLDGILRCGNHDISWPTQVKPSVLCWVNWALSQPP